MSVEVKDLVVADLKSTKDWVGQHDDVKGVLDTVKSSSHQFAYTAWANNLIIALLASWKNPMHPYCTYIKIVHKKNRYDFVVVKSLLDRLIRNKIVYPIQTSLWESSHVLRASYEAYGFKEVRKTYMPSLYVEQLDASHINELEKSSILSLREVKENDSLRHQLIELVKINYERTHMINPVATLGVKTWEGLIFAEDLIENGSFIAVDKMDDRLLAYSFLHHSTSQGTVELGWCGLNNNEEVYLLANLVKCQINFAKQADYQKMEGEFDTTDPYSMQIMKYFPFKSTKVWVTYQLKEPPAI